MPMVEIDYSMPIIDLLGGTVSPNYEICRSTFPDGGVEFVAEGLGTLELCGKMYALRPGPLFNS